MGAETEWGESSPKYKNLRGVKVRPTEAYSNIYSNISAWYRNEGVASLPDQIYKFEIGIETDPESIDSESVTYTVCLQQESPNSQRIDISGTMILDVYADQFLQSVDDGMLYMIEDILKNH